MRVIWFRHITLSIPKADLPYLDVASGSPRPRLAPRTSPLFKQGYAKFVLSWCPLMDETSPVFRQFQGSPWRGEEAEQLFYIIYQQYLFILINARY